MPAPKSPTVLARIAGFIVQAAAARGVDTARLLQGSDLDPEAFRETDARITLDQETALWERAAQLTHDPCFGLHTAALIRPGAFDAMDYAVRTAPTLRSALERLARYNRLVHDLAVFQLHERGERLVVEHGFAATGAPACAQASDFTLASLLVVAAQMSGEPLKVHAVAFVHPLVGDVTAYRRVFGVLPAFGSRHTALTLDTAQLERPLPAADPGLSRIVTAHADRLLAERSPALDTLSHRVREHIGARLAEGLPTLAQVAASLHMSERSLQRHLVAEGSRFADLLEQVRRDLAMRYIADHRLALGEVAYLLGFAEPSPFHRAFKRWTGLTPAAARRQARAGMIS